MAELPAGLLRELRAVAGPDAVLDDPADCWSYGYDNSRRQGRPDAVVLAQAEDQIAPVVRACRRHGVPLVARGRGTGTCGATVPLGGGVVLSCERLDRVLESRPEDRYLEVEPGVTNRAVQEAAAGHGLFWPPDPSSADYCTVGGNLAFNAAGPRAVKYGTCRENVLGLRAVTGAGEIIHTGVYTTKGVVGYDLTRLLIGSEGTLAVITRATLKLLPRPEARRSFQAVYTDLEQATAAIVRIMNQPHTPCALEFMDANAIQLIREHGGVELPRDAGALLLLEADGPASAMDEIGAALEAAAAGPGRVAWAAARDRAEAAALWAARKALSPALRSIAPNKLNEDVVVPVSRIPALIRGLDRLSREYGIPIVNFGHAGNGNIHVNLLYDTQDPRQADNARPCLSAVFDLVLSLRGSLSGEHGVGLEKQAYIEREIDPVTLDLMRRIRAQFDPDGILNPGKMFPRPNI